MEKIADGFCTQCGNQIYAGNKFCMACGAPIKPRLIKEEMNEPVSLTAEEAPADKVEMNVKSYEDTSELTVAETEKMYCQYCGAQIDADSVFCIVCGKKV